MIITKEDMRRKGYCVKTSKLFCKRHNIDFKKFMIYGIDEKMLLDTGDYMAISLVEEAKEWAENQQVS